MAERIDPRVSIGHVHLKVADLDRAVAFYHGVLGFEVMARMGPSAAFLSAGGYHHHIGLNTWESLNGPPPPPNTTGLYHVAIRYPDASALADALRRLVEAQVPLDGASDHGVSEALYLRDPDGNGIELYWDRPREQWPRSADGAIADDDRAPRRGGAARRGAVRGRRRRHGRRHPRRALRSDAARGSSDLRARLLALHKSLLDDAQLAYEMDRGARVSRQPPATGHQRSLVRLAAASCRSSWSASTRRPAPDSAFTEGDAKALLDQVDRLLLPSETGDTFARRYYEALQRQPAVVLAHGAVKRVLKAS